jgi:Flp pilus assembly protein TadG
MVMQLKDQKGAAFIEFTIIFPLLMVLIFGIVEFGLILYNQQVITNASREGARAGIVARDPRLDSAGIEAVVNNYTQNRLISFGSSYATTSINNAGGTTFGKDLSVTVSYDYEFLVLPKFVESLTGDIQLSARSVMKYE